MPDVGWWVFFDGWSALVDYVWVAVGWEVERFFCVIEVVVVGGVVFDPAFGVDWVYACGWSAFFDCGWASGFFAVDFEKFERVCAVFVFWAWDLYWAACEDLGVAVSLVPVWSFCGACAVDWGE